MVAPLEPSGRLWRKVTTADSVAAFQQAITTKEATVLVYNVQTSTDVTNTIKQMATQQGIPVVAVSETLQPPDATFQEWQLGELNALYNALQISANKRFAKGISYGIAYTFSKSSDNGSAQRSMVRSVSIVFSGTAM